MAVTGLPEGRVLVVVQRYGDGVAGGAEAHARELSKHLAPMFDVTVATTTARDYWTWREEFAPGDDVVDGLTVKRFAVAKGRAADFRRHERAAFAPGHTLAEERAFIEAQGPVAPALLEYVATSSREYDAVVFFTYIYYPTAYGVVLAPERAILVPTAHDEPALRLTAYRALFHAPRAIAFNTEEERAMVHQRFDNARIPNEVVGVGVDRPSGVSGERFRAKYGLEGPLLLYIGRIVEGKGCDQLFADFARWKDDSPSRRATLVLMGHPQMAIPSRPDIRYLGYASDQDKFDAYEAADVFVIPSKLESLSIVSLEAWSCGRPLLCHAGSDVLRSMSRRAGAGLYYRDYAEFAELLDVLLADPGLRRKLGESGRAFVERTYTWPVVVEKYRDLIAEVKTRNS